MATLHPARLGALLVAACLLVLAPGPAAQSVSGELAESGAIPGSWHRTGTLHKVLLSAGDPRSETLRAASAILRTWDYGTSTVLVVDESRIGNLQAAGYPVRDEHDLVAISGWLFDGLRPEATLSRLHPAERFPETPDGSLLAGVGLYLVKFEAPVRDDWLAALESTGARLVQPMPMNAYVVRAEPDHMEALSTFGAVHPAVQYVGAWQPGFRMAPVVREAAASATGASMPVTVQLVDGPTVREAAQIISVFATRVLHRSRVGPYVNLAVDLDPAVFRTLAAWPEVFAIEPRGTPQKNDERQGQIVSGNISGTNPSGTGYLAWLASEGFGAGQFGSFSVNVVDDSFSLTGHPDVANSRVAFSQNPTGQSATQGGHGFLNAHIVAGHNSGTGSTLEDAQGYNYGLGIAPWAHVGATAIFGPGGASITSWESAAYNLGARISTNSWSFVDGSQNPIPDYDSNSQQYDTLTRDARSSQGGNQEYLIISSAGNDGPTGNTISTPSSAKNIITVGASENVRQTGTDGCGVGNSGADDLTDMISFSSHGPVNSSGGDGRYKPEIVAPGTHIQAGIPQSNYGGGGTCNMFWPLGSTLYGWSSGTSHSTPAVAGGAALVRQDFLNSGFSAPSPAMVKAVLLNSSRYMTGSFANDTLPSNSQGMGMMDLGMAFDATSKMLVDQTDVLGSTGASFVLNGQVADPGQPFRVTLVWTDAPGPTTGAPWVNDLDLQLSVGGNTYRGNVFSGATSTTGGSADFRNNNESVFLPAGTSGNFSVTVTGSTIAGNGLPGNADGTDQDFALVVYNGTVPGGGPIAAFTGTPTSGLTPLPVTFADLSSGTNDTWSWTFGDGGTSTQQNPSHTYTTAGTYTVSLMVSGAGGSDTNTKVGYITVSDPPPPGVSDGSFESQTAGTTPTTPWSVTFGGGHVVNPTGGSNDNGMPTDGSQWGEISATSTNDATPPSNPAGLTTPPVGGAGIAQSFTYPAGNTLLKFSAAFLRNEGANQSQFNDWMSVELSDGSNTYNLYYKDTFSATAGTSAKWGYAMTPVEEVTTDLLGLFPSSTTSTSFTLTASIGNGADDFQPSNGYLDDVRLEAPVGAPTAAFSATPTSGLGPLAVSFSDASTGGVTSWSWNFGDTGTSTAQSPLHLYSTAGTYTVTLTVTGPGGSDGETKVGYITVNEPAPIAEFSGTPVSGTLPLLVDFSDLSTGGPVTSWAWDFGDTNSSTAQDPSHTYTTAGTYTVTLTATGPGGSDGETKVGYITVSEPVPVAEFSGTPTFGTLPLLVDFSDLSSGGPTTSWAWDFGDTNSSTAENPSHTYTTAGTYTVTLTATGPGGSDGETKIGYITVSDPAPVAEFSGSLVSGTLPLLVDFTDLSTGGPVTSWAWDLGDTNTSTAQNPSHTYTTAGTYTVTLTATGPGGSDGETKVGYITVSEPVPVAEFSGTPTFGTLPLLVDFSDLSSGGPTTSWAWDFGDTNSSTAENPSHTYTTAGTYTVTLTATGPGGSDGETKIGYITVSDPAPVAEFSGTPTSGTLPVLVNFSDLSSGGPVTTWAWDFGDTNTSTAQNPAHTFTTAGTYTVTLTATGPGGADGETKIGYITVSEPAPIAEFSGTPTSGTLPLLVNFSDLSTGGPTTSWAWDFGDTSNSTTQNPSHIYTIAGTYTVTLTATGPGGSDGETKVGYITVSEPAPVAEFSGAPTSGTLPLLVSFSDLSTGGPVTSWAWNFGDTNSSTAQNPSHTYTTAGTYTVTLTATGPGGSDGETKVGYITVSEQAPIAEFSGTPTSGILPLVVNFSDLSSGGPVTTWAWDFGDTNSSTAQNPSHTYTTAGTFTVTLTSTGPGGSDGETKVGYITVSEPAPVAEFSGTPTSGTLPVLVSFSDLSTGGPVTSWAWNFGDTNSSTAQNPSHTYTTAGTYTVTLTATGPGGSDGETKVGYITVSEQAPIAEFSGTPTSGTLPLLVNFSDLSTGGPVTTWAWDFGDTNASTAQNPSHTYTTAGTFTVTLTSTGPGGSDGETKVGYITVSEPAPIAEFSGTPTSGTLPLLVNFSDLSTGGPTTSWAWDFGDTNTSTSQNPSHTYTTAGTYTVTLTATGPGGSDGETKVGYITVNEPAPVAEFSGTPTSGTLPVLVSFSDLSTGGPVTSWAWNFGDTNSSTAQNPSHTYTAAGTYTVTLTATGPGGSDGETKVGYITVNEPAPVAEFSGTPTSGTLPVLVNFSDLSSGGPVTTWAWDFGDTSTSTSQHPSHTYTIAGTYTVTLTATGPGGSDGETKVGYITVSEPAPVAEFSGTATSGILPLVVNFSDLSSGGPVTTWAWDFGDTNSSTAQNPSHTYTAAGTYTVTLIATGPGGFDGETKIGYITVSEPAPIAEFSGTPTSGTLPLLVDFSDLSSGGPTTSWAWDFGDTNTSTSQNPSHTYTTAGTFTVTLTSTGPGGSDGETKVGYITVSEPAPIAEFSGTPTSGTLPLLVDFSDLSSGGPTTSWAWDFGDTNTSTAQNPSHTYTSAGTYTVTLTATGPGGSDGETKVGYITVGEPAPVAAFTGTPASGTAPVVVDFSDQSRGGPITSWLWDFGDGGSSTDSDPSHVYMSPGVFTVTLMVAGPGGMNTITETDFVTVEDPRRPLVDGSFEGQAPGAAPGGVWTVLAGSAHLVHPDTLNADGELPSGGDQWLELAADGTDDASPPSNPGGAGDLPEGGNSVAQAFSFPLGRHRLSFDAAFLRDGAANSASANDWMSVDITDGTTTRNVFYADSFTATPATSAIHGLPMTDLSTVNVNLQGLFPGSTHKTVFTIILSVGNGGDATSPSKGYVDHVRLDPYRKKGAEGTLTLQ